VREGKQKTMLIESLISSFALLLSIWIIWHGMGKAAAAFSCVLDGLKFYWIEVVMWTGTALWGAMLLVAVLLYWVDQ
jgi:hypothetical protein